MVQTRSASGVDVPPPATPAAAAAARPRSSAGTVAASAARSTRARKSATPAPSTPTASSASSSTTTTAWVYVPDTLTLLWLAVSLPLVAWDTGYVLLRPRTMPGGALHWPLWAPYALYGEVDHVYGFKQWNRHSGFTGAQASLNLVESLLYLAFLYLWHARGRAPAPAARKALAGRTAAWAVLLAFSGAVMTLSKTVLYWLNESFSGFDNIGHNDAYSLIVLWIIPNGLWIVFPAYMVYVLGGEIARVLASASEGAAIKEE